MVLTHGMPWVLLSTRRTSAVLRTWFSSNHVFRARRFVALASRTANADFAVHGSGMPWKSPTTEPYRVDQNVWWTGFSEPSAWRTWTATSRDVIFSGLPSTRYVVGSPGFSGTSKKPNVTGVATVCV